MVKVEGTRFEGLLLLEPEVLQDGRGFFMESYNERSFTKAGIDVKFIQDNQSHSNKNVIRGLHFQKPPFAQTKLVKVVYGSVLDVVVDLRRNQATFGEAYITELSADNKKQLLIPRGFAHGFSVLSETAGLFYKCDEYYNQAADAGLYYNDPKLKIDWKVKDSEAIVSAKDKALPSLSELPILF